MSAVTHDFSKRYWGHDYMVTKVIDAGQEIKMMGWGGDCPGFDKRPEEGDFLILVNGDTTTRYRVSAVFHYHDPRDMWRLTADFAPRPTPENSNAG